MRSNLRLVVLTLSLTGCMLGASLALAVSATCRDPRGFDAFMADMKAEAAAQGVAASAIAALDGVAYDPGIIAKDHSQHVFKQSFEQFSARLVNANRMRNGVTKLKQYASVLSRIEEAYGVPGPVIVAIWGLETDFGAGNGARRRPCARWRRWPTIAAAASASRRS